MTIKHNAIILWIGYLVTLPVIALWMWDRIRLEFFARGNPFDGLITYSTKKQLENRKPPRTALISIGMAFFFLLATWPVIILCTLIINWATILFTGQPLDPIAHQTLGLLQSQPEMNRWVFLVILAVVIGAPVIEEIVYRGTIQALIRSSTISPWPSILITATIFSLVHYRVTIPAALPGLFILGLGLGIAYDYTGRIITPIIMHLLFNLANIIMALA